MTLCQMMLILQRVSSKSMRGEEQKLTRQKEKEENKEEEIKELKFILIVNILITTWRICGFVTFYTYLY